MLTSAEFERECSAYCQHLNELLAEFQEDELKTYLPLQPDNLLGRLRDGVLLGYVLEYLEPGCVHLEEFVRGIDLDSPADEPGKQCAVFEATANLNRALKAAKGLKQLVLVNIGSEDILAMNADVVLGLLWQLIRSQLLGRVNLVSHPELIRLLEVGENLAILASLRPEPLLLRWLNYHLARSGAQFKVSSLTRDITNGEAYLHLLTSIDSGLNLEEALTLSFEERANLICLEASKLGSAISIKPSDIQSGHPRLNLAFLASLFNVRVGIHLPSEEEVRELLCENSRLKAELEVINSKMESEDLSSQLESLRLVQQSELANLEADFETFKDELAAQYKESLESAITTERRIHQHELGDLRASLKDVRRKLVGLVEECGVQIDEGSSIDQALQIHTSQLRSILDQLKLAQKQNEILQNELEHKERVEAVMAAKIKQYSENMIQEHQEQQLQLQQQKLKRVPALEKFKRILACQGH